MSRLEINALNRRRILAEALNACTAQDIREEVSAALHRKYPSKGHAVHIAAEILDATHEFGMPPRDIECVVEEEAPDDKREEAALWAVIAAVVALAAFGLWHSYSAKVTATDEQTQEWRDGQ